MATISGNIALASSLQYGTNEAGQTTFSFKVLVLPNQILYVSYAGNTPVNNGTTFTISITHTVGTPFSFIYHVETSYDVHGLASASTGSQAMVDTVTITIGNAVASQFTMAVAAISDPRSSTTFTKIDSVPIGSAYNLDTSIFPIWTAESGISGQVSSCGNTYTNSNTQTMVGWGIKNYCNLLLITGKTNSNNPEVAFTGLILSAVQKEGTTLPQASVSNVAKEGTILPQAFVSNQALEGNILSSARSSSMALEGNIMTSTGVST
jgi:hypothetical protein